MKRFHWKIGPVSLARVHGIWRLDIGPFVFGRIPGVGFGRFARLK